MTKAEIKKILQSHDDLGSQYAGGTVTSSDDSGRQKMVQLEVGKEEKQERWAYRMLLECEPLMKFSDMVVQQVYHRIFPQLFRASSQPQQIEWLLLLDNSGSMILYVAVDVRREIRVLTCTVANLHPKTRNCRVTYCASLRRS